MFCCGGIFQNDGGICFFVDGDIFYSRKEFYMRKELFFVKRFFELSLCCFFVEGALKMGGILFLFYGPCIFDVDGFWGDFATFFLQVVSGVDHILCCCIEVLRPGLLPHCVGKELLFQTKRMFPKIGGKPPNHPF